MTGRRHRQPVTPVLIGVRLCLVLPIGGAFAVSSTRAQHVARYTDSLSSSDTVVLSLDVVRRLAVQNNPTYLGALQETAAARGALRQSRIWRFNPELGLQAPGAGPNASPYQLTFTQEIEWAGQRGLRSAAARSGVVRAGADARNVGRRTLADASIAYYRAVAAAQRLRVAEAQVALTDRLLAAVRTQAREGEISALDASLADIEAARVRARVLAARRVATSAQLDLARSIGLTPGVPIRFVEDVAALAGEPSASPTATNPDSLVRLALARRPDVVAAQAAIREAQQRTALARREALPNVRFGALAERDRDGVGDPRIGATIGLALPLFNRNQGVRDQRAAEARRAVLEAREVELRVRAEVLAAWQTYATATEEMHVFARSVRAPARENSARLESAYTAGKTNLATLLLLRNQLLDAELGYWDAWLTQYTAQVELDAATGALDPRNVALSTLHSLSSAPSPRNVP
jgi:cobalt-zinc-cadmium efflux system outer membrane protein